MTDEDFDSGFDPNDPFGSVARILAEAASGLQRVPDEEPSGRLVGSQSPRFIERLGALTRGAIFRGSAAYGGSVLTTAIGSGIFWILATHLATRPTVGRAAALAAILFFLIYLSALPLTAVVARYGAGSRLNERVVLNRSLLAAGLVSLSGALLITLVAVSTRVAQAAPLRSPSGVLVFTAIALGSTLTILVDIRLLAECRYRWMISRAFAANAACILLLVVGGFSSSALGIFVASNGPVAVSGLIAWFGTQRHTSHWLAIRPRPPDFDVILRFARVSGFAALLGQAAPFGLPVLVAITVSSSANAQFYIAWNILTMALLTITSVGAALLTHGGRRDDALRAEVRQATRFALIVAGLVMLGMLIGSPLVTLVYGSGYAGSARLVRWLSLSCLPLALYTVSFATARIQHLSRAMLGFPLILAVGVLVPAVPLTIAFSVGGATAAWLMGVMAAGVLGAVVLRAMLTAPGPETRQGWDVEAVE
jgi:O-antigen/teichoic acid export membrane protein